MNQIKRKLRFDRSYYQTIKKSRHEMNIELETMSTTSIENLSNEFFYEIFDYLDGCEIYYAFSNLNYRFQQLLESSSLLFRIKFHHSISKKEYMNKCKQMIFLNRNKIFSMNLCQVFRMKQSFFTFNIDSSLYRLQSITLNRLDSKIIMPLIIKLSGLPSLFSLSIRLKDHLKDLTDIYRIVLTLPMLKYYKLDSCYCDVSVSLPMATNKQFNMIENLVISHSCTLEELSAIISYTPQLRRLNLSHRSKNDPSIETFLPITLSNLTYISIRVHPESFDEFEILFIQKIYSNLKILRVATYSEDESYFDADRWEEIISKYFPRLEKFYFQYYECGADQFESYLGEPNQFSSSFWIERQWIYNKIEINHECIIYSITPYKKRWYEYIPDKFINSSIELSKSNRLIHTDIPFKDAYDLVIQKISHVLLVAEIYHLEIPYDKIFIGLLIQIINSLPELISLQIHSLSLNRPRNLYQEENDILCLTKDTSKIQNVYLKKMIKIQDVYFLIQLCPYMKYFKIDDLNKMDVGLFVRNILEKINNDCNQYLRLLCFRVPAADDEMIKKLEQMINHEKLLHQFVIKRVIENIYLQWE